VWRRQKSVVSRIFRTFFFSLLPVDANPPLPKPSTHLGSFGGIMPILPPYPFLSGDGYQGISWSPMSLIECAAAGRQQASEPIARPGNSLQPGSACAPLSEWVPADQQAPWE